MKVKPIMPKLFARRASLGLNKGTASGAGVNSGVNSGVNQAVKAAKRPFYKVPKIRNGIIGTVAGLGAAIAAIITTCCPKSYDVVTEANMYAYAESKDMTQSEAESFSFPSIPVRNRNFAEARAGERQRKLDITAFSDILVDCFGDKDEWDYWSVSKNIPSFERYKIKRKDLIKSKLEYIKDNMSAKEYTKLMDYMDYEHILGQPYYQNTFTQFIADSVAFQKYLQEKGIADNPQIQEKLTDICEKIKPDHLYGWSFDIGYKMYQNCTREELFEMMREKYD